MKTLYRATRVRTLSHTVDGEWLLVDGRHVERVGSGDPPAADRTVELPGTTIIPGFVDAHVHLTGTGLNRSGPDLTQARSKEHLLDQLSDAARSTDGAVLVHGFDETTWDRPELPSVGDLDGASPEPLVCVRADGHVSLANSAAIAASGADGIDGTERDERGWPTGVLRREANGTLRSRTIASSSISSRRVRSPRRWASRVSTRWPSPSSVGCETSRSSWSSVRSCLSTSSCTSRQQTSRW